MLQKFVKNIRAKPESVRKGITLGISLGITTIVAFFWFISFLNYSTQVLTAKPKVESPTSFLNKMSSLIGESYANVRTKIDPSNNGFFGEKTDENTNENSGENANENTATSTVDVETDSENVETGSENIETSDDAVETETGTTKIEPKTDDSKSLGDILNTKSRVNQENKATTSGEVLVQ